MLKVYQDSVHYWGKQVDQWKEIGNWNEWMASLRNMERCTDSMSHYADIVDYKWIQYQDTSFPGRKRLDSLFKKSKNKDQ